MNADILKKAVDELKKEKPNIDYVRGMLETLYELENPKPRLFGGEPKTEPEPDGKEKKKKLPTPDPEATDVPANRLPKAKEEIAKQVHRLQAEGKNSNEIALELKISPITVERLLA